MGNIKHILWDWNGTLLNDAWLFVDVMNSVLKKRGMDRINKAIYRDIFTFPVKEYYVALGYNLKKEPFEASGLEFIQAYHRRQFDADLFEDVVPFLDRCLKNGITHSIVSAQNQQTLDVLVSYYKIKNRFAHIYGLDNDYADGKIHVGLRVASLLPYDKNQILFVGDTVHDVEVADAIGIKCVLVSRGHNSIKRLQKTGCEVFGKLSHIIGVRGLIDFSVSR